MTGANDIDEKGNGLLTSGVTALLERVANLWIGRSSRFDPTAVGAVSSTISPLGPAVVVTGGSTGIGLSIAREFAARGRTVLLVARDPDRLEAAAASLRVSRVSSARPAAGGSRVATLSLDVTAPGADAAIANALAGNGWYLDILVNSAGVGLSGSFADAPVDALDRLLATNAEAATRLTRRALPAMLARGRGGIINVASLGGYVPGPNQAAYYASKAFVASLTRAVRSEIGGRGVRVMVLAPGPVETGFHGSMGAEGALYRRLLPAMSAERVARAAVVGYALGHATVIPGILPRLLAVSVAVLPNAITLPIVNALLANGQRHGTPPGIQAAGSEDCEGTKIRNSREPARPPEM